MPGYNLDPTQLAEQIRSLLMYRGNQQQMPGPMPGPMPGGGALPAPPSVPNLSQIYMQMMAGGGQPSSSFVPWQNPMQLPGFSLSPPAPFNQFFPDPNAPAAARVPRNRRGLGLGGVRMDRDAGGMGGRGATGPGDRSLGSGGRDNDRSTGW